MVLQKKYKYTQRRRVEGKTNYSKRLELLKSGKVRMVVRKTSRSIICQIVQYVAAGDKVVLSAHSNELVKLGWKLDKKNIPCAYLVGFLLGKKAKAKGIKEAILDIGVTPSTKGSRLYAAAKGALDAGLNTYINEKIAPSEDRIRGKHIEGYAQHLKENKALFNKHFSQYLKAGIDPTKISSYFDGVKKKITEV